MSVTVIEEHGVFKRTLYRKGKKKRQITKRQKENPKKVVLAKLNDLEMYCYPYDFPDKVFMGKYPNFTMELDIHDLPKLFVFYNKARWFLTEMWLKKRHKTKRADYTSTSIVKAYDSGVKQVKEVRNKTQKI